MGLLPDASKLMSSLMLLLYVHIHAAVLSANAGPSTVPPCRTSCGNHIIKFPFGIDAGCGSPQFSMYCTNGSTLQMVFNSKVFPVERIDYINHLLLLRDPLMSDCTNLNFNSAGLALNLDNTGLTLGQGSTILLLNCLSFSQEIDLLNNQYDCHNPTCLAFIGSCHTNDLLTSCCRVTDPHDKIDLYPMQCMSYTSVYNPQDPIFNPSSWSYGIELQWTPPSDVSDACDRCEGKNGVCGYNSKDKRQQFTCICDSSLRCKGCISGSCAGLHFRVSPPIYHRDVKSGNILLDERMKAKVADFGLSRLVPMDATHVSTGPQGTPGYVDPEYHQCYQVSDKSDVYSFGVVLLEMISGKRAVDLSRARHEINLSAFAIARIQSGALHELLDPHLLSSCHSQPVHQVANLAFSCIALERQARPNMKEVSAQLQLIRSTFKQASQLRA